jgi:hypothetical protein
MIETDQYTRSGRRVIDYSRALPARRDPVYVYDATADAEWSATNSRWEVTAKRVKQDNTLSSVEQTKAAYGIETDDVPIKSGDRCIETITAEGKRGLVVVSGRQLDHSFLPQPSTTEGVWFDVTGGFVLFDGAWESVDAFTIAEDETDTHWWLEIDDASEIVDITVESGGAWPTTEGLKFIRLFEFGEAGVLSSITRHTTNDVVWAGGVFDADVTDSTRKSLEKCPVDDAGKDAGQIYGFDDATGHKVPHVLASEGGAREVEWRWPVKGPDNDTDVPGAITDSTVVVDVGLADPPEEGAYISFTPILRSHDVADGGETWGDEDTTQTRYAQAQINYEDIIGAPDPGDPWPGDAPPEEYDCDQNDHPGDDEYDTGAGGGEDDEHPGDDDTQGGYGDGDQDDNDHPGSEDCYTTT